MAAVFPVRHEQSGIGNNDPRYAPQGPRAPANSAWKRNVAINRTLCRAGSPEEVLAVVETSYSDFNCVNIATALNRLGRFGLHCKSSRLPEGVKLLEMLVLKNRSEFGERELTTSLAGLAKTGFGSPDMFYEMRLQALEKLQGMDNQQGLSQIVWSYATVRCYAKEVFFAASAQVKPMLYELSAQALSNIAWAYATVGHHDKELFRGLADSAIRSLRSLEPQHLVNLVWAFAKAQHPAPELFERVGFQAVREAARFTPQGLSNLVWSFVTAGYHAPDLFDAVAVQAVKKSSDFNPQCIANTTWSFAKMDHASPELFLALGKQALLLAAEFTPQHISNTSWAYSNAGIAQPRLFHALARHAVGKIRGFAPHGLSAMAWAYATADQRSPVLFEAIRYESMTKLHDFTPCGLSQLAWAMATSGVSSPEFFSSLVRTVQPVLADLAPQGLCNLIWAVSSVGHAAASLYDAVAREAIPKISRFNAQSLALVSWSYAVARHPSPELFYAIGAEVGSRMDEFSLPNISLVCTAFASLGHPAGNMIVRSALNSAVAWSMEYDAHSLVNVAHSAAILGCLEPRDLKNLGPRLLSLHYAMELPSEAYRSLFLCALSIQAIDNSTIEARQPLLLPMEVLVEARRHSLKGGQLTRESRLRSEVLDSLEQIFPCQIDGRTADGLLDVDIMVEARGGEVAVEVCSAADFSRTIPRMLLGEASLRHRLLKARCSEVVTVPFYEWESISGADERKAYLMRKLEAWAAPAVVDMLPSDLLSDLY